METYYIIDPVNYDGAAKSIMQNGVVAWTDGLTFEQYKNKKGNENLIVLNENDWYNDYHKPYLESLITPWEEISLDRWEEMLNVLPPMKWHNYKGLSIFFISEAYTENLHSCFVKNTQTGKCYESLRNVFSSDKKLLIDFPE